MPQSASEEIAAIRAEIRKLKSRITLLQDECLHTWKQVTSPDLKNSLVAGVYVGNYEGRITVSEPKNLDFKCECEKCGKVLVSTITSTCPHCLVNLKDEEYNGHQSVHNRKDYFGREYLYFGVSIQMCSKCDFRIASDIWDQ
ncbi:MAG: hypothetical protein AAB389_00335 [Patescibacteria group bacterium]